MNRLLEKYTETVKPSLMKGIQLYKYNEAPKIVKVVINIGCW